MILTKICFLEDNITEKFALLNLIKALQGISAPSGDGVKGQTAPPPANTPVSDAPQKENKYNAMASVLERHEAISNRVKNKK